MSDRRVVRSYQAAFDFEPRLHGFGDLVFPRPVPLRGVLYAVALEALMFAAGHLPLIGGLVRAAGWELRWVFIPLPLAWLLSVARIEGRRFHVALRAWARHWCSRRHLIGGWRAVPRPGAAWQPPSAVLIGDGRQGRPVSRLELRGPGRVLIRYPCRARQAGMVLRVQQTSRSPVFPGKVVEIPAGASVRFCAGELAGEG